MISPTTSLFEHQRATSYKKLPYRLFPSWGIDVIEKKKLSKIDDKKKREFLGFHNKIKKKKSVRRLNADHPEIMRCYTKHERFILLGAEQTTSVHNRKATEEIQERALGS